MDTKSGRLLPKHTLIKSKGCKINHTTPHWNIANILTIQKFIHNLLTTVYNPNHTKRTYHKHRKLRSYKHTYKN